MSRIIRPTAPDLIIPHRRRMMAPTFYIAGNERFQGATFSAPSSSFLLNSLTSSAIIAYSTRKLSSSYAGNAIQSFNTNTLGTQDIGFVGNDLDTASLATFLGASSGQVAIWYDQSVSAANAVITGNHTQFPYTTVSGTNLTVNGHIAVRGDAADISSLTITPPTTPQPLTVAMCIKLNSATNEGSAHWQDGNAGLRVLLGTSTNVYQIYAGATPATGGTLDTTNVHTLICVFNGASSILYVDGVNTINGTNIGTNGFNGTIAIFGVTGGNTALDSYILEYLAFAGTLSSPDMATIRSSWQSYWGAN